MRPDDLIERLVADAHPVRRLSSPLVRSAIWCGATVLFVGLFALGYGLRVDLPEKLGEPLFVNQMTAALLTGVAAAIAAFHLSLPDRPVWLAWLPVPPLVFWIGTLSTGCFLDWIDYGADGLAVGNSAMCFVLIAVSGTVPAGLLYAMLRRTRPFRPMMATVTGALAVASLAAAGLRLFHELDASLMVLVWQFGSVAAIVAAMSSFGSRLWPRVDPKALPLFSRST
ncbi:MAG: DUF1109 domain-containing protein [Proteobacteria bacterium]|nr:DUF1109 domain-containing protein [Pseudomonadota bacterium]